ncbi:Glucoamylase (glucan-1,4-alpha-glucosidase), GH15 family [Paraburkholderia fungorum]|uniref:Glucoamylase (Glucan-1,4-alpha-glucosidase), GH15 family n=1 Tax=Paraburkholderia fungorum TaxID=134537 RepID=A0A1H1JVZ1_9BURK|nr:glycoside hydrolase family 15 protein [Paraburkholderia fungorum]SDR54233.1 Glucoamylase (glucan-1,4-alpha-glucosidase), GH15 family [Paraburkholderia fungorum]
MSDTRKDWERSSGGALALRAYGAIGDGRSVALSGADGSIDWWCVPGIDSPPLFDRLLDPERGGFFALTPTDPFTAERRYRPDSNVLETTFTTASGEAKLAESHNSSGAGRLPWAELARRIEGIAGTVRFDIRIRWGRQGDTINPYCSVIGGHDVFHAGRVLGLFLHSEGLTIDAREDGGLTAHLVVCAGHRETVAIVAGQDEPLVVPPIEQIDRRIDRSDEAWREWTHQLRYDGAYRSLLVRSALALKLLLYSPSGAIAAAATTSLPERVGGSKNFDYRYAWVRDAGYTIKAFLRIDAQEEAKAAFSWLLRQIENDGARVLFPLSGGVVPAVTELDLPGYRNSTPVVVGNAATNQHQHGIYGDIFGTAAEFVRGGNILDSQSAQTLSRLADQCADRWRREDAGIWELEEARQYTMSKFSAWEALARAVELADSGQLPTTCRDRWERERDRIAEWINEHGWSEERSAYVMYPGSDRLDASIALAVRFRFGDNDRMEKTLDAIQRELGNGPYHHRYSGVANEEGAFLACTFWQIEARALLGQTEVATRAMDAIIQALQGGTGIYPEMADPHSGEFLGNLPQGLTHLALVQALTSIATQTRSELRR